MNSYNTVGRLTKAPLLKKTKTGIAVCTYTLAVDRPGTYGENKKVDYIDGIFWRKTAENFSKICRKGTMISLTGMITTRIYTKTTGENVKVTELYANGFQVLKQPLKREEPSIQEELVDSTQDHLLKNEEDYFFNVTDDDVPF